MIRIYTDASFSHRENRGTWAFIILDHNALTEQAGFGKGDHNRLELEAVVRGLSQVKVGSRAKIYTDSTYVYQLTQGARAETNLDLVSDLKSLQKGKEVKFKLIKRRKKSLAKRVDDLVNNLLRGKHG